MRSVVLSAVLVLVTLATVAASPPDKVSPGKPNAGATPQVIAHAAP